MAGPDPEEFFAGTRTGPATVAGRSHFRVPAPLTTLIGREQDVAAVSALLGEPYVRLLTLTGPAGVGKTRLAIAIAQNIRSQLADGVVFVSLASARSVESVSDAIDRALAIDLDPSYDPAERLVHYLRDRRLLLVLDNFEHLLPGASLVADLLAKCPGLSILITSRTLLRLAEEHGYPVPPLALPPDEAGPFATEDAPLTDSPAVRLFAERAATADPRFRLDRDNERIVAAICRRLDGLPLAIELAAARTRVLTPGELLARLGQRFTLLTTAPRDAPDRHQTLRDAIAWSYDLLSPDQQVCFRRLAVFTGGFPLAAARAMESLPPPEKGGRATVRRDEGAAISTPDAPIQDEPGEARPSLDGLEQVLSLVDQSLLSRVEAPGPEPRLGMLETIRELGLERLAASGEEEAIRNAHADWCVSFAERAEPELSGPNQLEWVRRIDDELPNIRAAGAWLRTRGDAGGALRMAGALGWYWSSGGHFQEGRELFASVLAMPGAETHGAAYAKALRSAGDIANWLNDVDEAETLYLRALARYRELNDTSNIIGMVRGLGSVALDQGEIGQAAARLAEARRLAAKAGNGWELAAASNLLAVVALGRGDAGAAMVDHEAAAAAWRAVADIGHVATALGGLALAALVAGDLPRAGSACSETLDLCAVEDDADLAAALVAAGGIAAAVGSRELAVRLLAAAGAIRRRLGVSARPAAQAHFDRFAMELRRDLGEAAFATAWSEGEDAQLDGATAGARAALDQAVRAGYRRVRSTSFPYGLSSREFDVFVLLAGGYTDREIAERLFISRPVASKHVSAILTKLGVTSRTAAVAIAYRDGLL